MPDQTGPAVKPKYDLVDRSELLRVQSMLRATQFVLGERERELLELKGPCSKRTCRLHYAHAGPCDVIGGEVRGEIVTNQPESTKVELPPRGHGYTTHGHWCCNLVAPSGRLPTLVARCMGPPGCSKCATEAVRIHMTMPSTHVDSGN